MATDRFFEERRWERVAPLAGVVAVALWLIGVILVETAADSPDENAVAADVLAFYEEGGGQILTGTYLVGLGMLFFLWFLGSLRSALVRGEGPPARLASVAFASGVATSILLLGFVAPSLAASLAVDEGVALSAEAAEALWTVEDGFFVAAWFPLAALFASTGVLLLRTGVLPRWLGWLSLVLVIVSLVPWTGWAAVIFALPVWVLIVSLLLWRTHSRVTETAAARST